MIKILYSSLIFSFLGCSSVNFEQKIERLKSYFDKPKVEKDFFRLSWNRNMDPDYSLGNLPIGWVTPVIHQEKIISGDLKGHLNIFTLDQGRVLKSIKEDGAIQGKPLILDNKTVVYGTSEGSLIARNINTGNLVYKKDLNSSLESEIVAYKNRLFIHLRNHTIAAADAKTGKILWSYKRAIPFLTTLNRVSIPQPYKDSIIVGFADGYLASLSIHDGSIVWEKKVATGKKFIDVDLKPVLIDGKIWVGSLGSDVFVINPKNGMTFRRMVFHIAVTPFEFKGNVVLLSDTGEAIISDKFGAVKSRHQLYDHGFSSAVVWKNRVVASTFDGKLLALSQDFKSIDDEFHFGHSYSSLFGYIEASESTLAAYSSRNRLYVFK